MSFKDSKIAAAANSAMTLSIVVQLSRQKSKLFIMN